jgi:hypothetical protein
MIFVPLSLAILLCGIALAVTLLHSGIGAIVFGPSALIALVPLVTPGAVLWIAGWIVEGFAKKEP